MKYYIIVGEASGDLHASNLVHALKSMDPDASFRGWGGDLMTNKGVILDQHFKNIAFMGFAEVIKNIKTIYEAINRCKSNIQEFKPDVLICVDYPGFNMRILKWATKIKAFKVYYITPQIWAWHASRVHQLHKNTNLLLNILPFEVDFFQKYDYLSYYVGHPLIDHIDNFIPDHTLIKKYENQNVIVLMPGSRVQEVKKMLPLMLNAIDQNDFTYVIAASQNLSKNLFEEIIAQNTTKNIKIEYGATYGLLSIAHGAIVTSGTATLETALFGVPQVVCYKGNAFSYLIAKRLVKVPYISLVNLILNKPLVKELIQSECTPKNINAELNKAIKSSESLKAEYLALRTRLGTQNASHTAASLILQHAKP